MNTHESRSIQVWPSGRMFTYRGDWSHWTRLEIKEGENWVRPSYDDFVEIHNSVLAEKYLEQDVLACQSSLVDKLLEAMDSPSIEGFGYEDVENRYREETDEDVFYVWNAGKNMPGYMPDEPPHPCYSREQAVDSLVEDIENAFDDWASGDVDEDSEEFKAKEAEAKQAKEDVEKLGEANFNGYAYFISENVATREELVDMDCDIDDYTSVDDEPFEEPREIYEWWLVDSWLCGKLRDIGQPVLDNGYGCWWGRTCTGQSMLMDGTLQQVAAEYVPEKGDN